MRDAWEGQARPSAVSKLEDAARQTIRNPENSPLDFLQEEARIDNEIDTAEKSGWSEKETSKLEYILRKFDTLPRTIEKRKQTREVVDMVHRGRDLEDLYKTRGTKPSEFVQKIIEAVDTIKPEDVFQAMRNEVTDAKKMMTFVDSNFEYWYDKTGDSLSNLRILASTVKELKGEIPSQIREADVWLKKVMEMNAEAFSASYKILAKTGGTPNRADSQRVKEGYTRLFGKTEQLLDLLSRKKPAQESRQ